MQQLHSQPAPSFIFFPHLLDQQVEKEINERDQESNGGMGGALKHSKAWARSLG